MAEMILHRVADDYLAGHSSTTRKTKRVILRGFMTWCDAQRLRLIDVRRVHIESYQRWLIEQRGTTTHTASTYVGVIGSFLAYAVDEGHIPVNPARHVRRGARVRHATSPWLTAPELRQLLTASSAHAHPDLNAAIHLLALNGIRISELLTLRVEDVHTIGGHLCVRLRHRKYSPGGQDLSLAPATITALEPLLATRRTGWLIRIPKRRGGPHAHMEERTRRHAARLRLQLRRLCEEQKLAVITPHGLRHTFITLARDAGIPDRDIMASVGHIDPRMLTYYDRAHASVERNATHQLAVWLDGQDE